MKRSAGVGEPRANPPALPGIFSHRYCPESPYYVLQINQSRVDQQPTSKSNEYRAFGQRRSIVDAALILLHRSIPLTTPNPTGLGRGIDIDYGQYVS